MKSDDPGPRAAASLTRLVRRLGQEWLLLLLLALLPVMLWLSPAAPATVAGLVDWKTIAALAGLMLLSRGLEDSGCLGRAGRWLLTRVHGERRLAAALVLFAGALSTVVTNDVALFIVVPLTLGLRAVIDLPLGRLVVFQALAVNAGSAVSPVGNPQNLFLWQTTGTGFFEFLLAMVPLAGVMMLILLALIPLAVPAKRLDVREALPAAPLRGRLMWLSLLCYPVFLLALEFGFAEWALWLLLVLYLLTFKRVFLGVDWLLLPVFMLMFVNLGLLARVPVIEGMVPGLLELPGGVFGVAAAFSQGMSNVPAAIFLESFTDDWRALAWGVSVGGFGLAIGSMANLIALRLARDPRLWLSFHVWSVPMLALSFAAGWLLL